MKKLMRIMFCFFAVSVSVQADFQKTATCSGNTPCQCAGCDQCAPDAQACGNYSGCYPNCVEPTPKASLYSLTGKKVIFYCVGGATINPVTEAVPSNYSQQKWYTCGHSQPFPLTNLSAALLNSPNSAYPFQQGDIFACPEGATPIPYTNPTGETQTPGISWFTCPPPAIDLPLDSSSSPKTP